MGREIERKFLPANDLWQKEKGIRLADITQGYMVENSQWILRVRHLQETFPQSKEQGFLTIKGNTPDQLGPTWNGHLEFEYAIPVADAQELLAATPLKIAKQRRWITYQNQTFEIDTFASGLVLIELELPDPGHPIIPPPWLGREVTGDKHYTNRYLAEHAAGKDLARV
ncbi:MAG: hypothetical protein J6Y94_03865 [Bacteriovoracaceae bacterium]|nr:hypothetical protein [Bacteriovoracaceae bacterium]